MARGRVEPDPDITNNGFERESVRTESWDADPEWGTEWTPENEFGDGFVQDEIASPPSEPSISALPLDDDATTVIPAVPAPIDPWESAEPFFTPSAATHDPGYDSYEDTYDSGSSQFQTDAYLRTPQKPTRTPAGRRRTLRVVGGLAATVAVAIGIVIVVKQPADSDGTSATPQTTAAVTSTVTTPSTVADAPSIGDTTSGPGVILGFDNAYYDQRSGAAAAAFLVPSQNTPATAAAIQTDVDRVDRGVKRNIVITSTEAENVYNVKLTLTTPDGLIHEYYQQYTVVSTAGRFYIANKLNCDSVCPTP